MSTWFRVAKQRQLRVGILIALVCLANSAHGQDFPAVSQLPNQPNLPDPLVDLSGKRVASSEDWFQKRRPELQKLFQHYMYGFLPPAVAIESKLEVHDPQYFGGKATKKQLTISFGPPTAPKINLLLVVPNKRNEKAPVFVGMNFCGNHALVNDPAIPLPEGWIYSSCQGTQGERATEASRGSQIDAWALESSIEIGRAHV